MKKQVISFVILAAIWGSSFLFMRISVREMGAIGTALFRVSLAGLFLLPFVLRRDLFAQLRQHMRPIFFVGLINTAIPFALFAYAVQYIPTGLAAILNATTPLFAAIVARVWLKEYLTSSRIVGLIVGFVGIALLTGRNINLAVSSHSLWAALGCLLATFCYAVSASFTKKYLTGIAPLTITTGSMLGATLGLLVPVLWFLPEKVPSAPAWAAAAVAAILCTAVAYILFFRLIQTIGPSRTITVTFLIPVFGLLYGALFLDEHITVETIFYGTIVILGTALATGTISLPKLIIKKSS